MDRFERLQVLERLQSECRSLEEQAELSQTMERAREGRFIPLGVFGEDVSPQEYFADEHDHLRQKTRDAYFSVTDLELRKTLIEAQRKAESHIRQSLEEEIIAANREVAVAAAKAQHQPWGKAALLGVTAVVVGYWTFAMVGAIAGAVASFFLGQSVISDARNEANAEFAQSSHELEQVKKEKEEHSLMPEFFSRHEEMSGNRDHSLDDELAYVNVLRSSQSG